jgi:hypothetical protein
MSEMPGGAKNIDSTSRAMVDTLMAGLSGNTKG